MKILAIDTATEACSAALYLDGETSQQYTVAPREHGLLILPMIERLLATAGNTLADLDAVAFGRGPGSFMGVRIAAGVVQGIAFARDLPVVPVSTLAAIAQSAYASDGVDRVLSAIDARMHEVYWAACTLDEQGCMQIVGSETVIAPDRVPSPHGAGWTGAGSGWSVYSDQLMARLGAGVVDTQLPGCLPTAASIVELAVAQYKAGACVTAAQAVPVYLRDNVANKPAA